METKKIEKTYHDLAKNGFTCEPIENGIRVKRKTPRMTDVTMDVSILESKQDIKNKSETNASDIEKDTIGRMLDEERIPLRARDSKS